MLQQVQKKFEKHVEHMKIADILSTGTATKIGQSLRSKMRYEISRYIQPSEQHSITRVLLAETRRLNGAIKEYNSYCDMDELRAIAFAHGNDEPFRKEFFYPWLQEHELYACVTGIIGVYATMITLEEKQ
jgi:hypothetical protein